MRIFLLLSAFSISFYCSGQVPITRFEQSGGRQTPTYPEVIDWWKKLDASSAIVSMQAMGPTDAGFPLHLIVISSDKTFSITAIKAKRKAVILVNNGIHPGEPDGIDASMLLAKNIVQGKYRLPSNVVLAIIPVYNIGGALNRSANYRVDQNGPEEFGFRGNSQNLDLNRDFIKTDSREALSFTRIFQMLDPDVFVDNHVSNGADYQHVMTLLSSQHNRLGGLLGSFMNRSFEPGIFELMHLKGIELVPYVNHFGDTPDKGWPAFWDSPRYGSGYGSLWGTFSFVPETHMLKPYDQRVHATRALMESFIEFTASNANQIMALRAAARIEQARQLTYPLAWKLDRSNPSSINFLGFEAATKTSQVSGLPRLYYDRSKPYQKQIPYWNTYVDTFSVTAPQAYLIPQGWWKVIERLQANGIRMKRLAADTTIQVEAYRIESYQSMPRPFEGHHLNTSVQVSKTLKRVAFRKGDYLIPLDQKGRRFLIEVLEPQAEDSYFAWNFFDPILGQKEGFSDYVFEETAAAYLKSHPDIEQKLQNRKRSDSTFAKSARAQLNFVYQNSEYYEPAHLQYPVFRVVK
jgi:hypothetical protein